MTKTACDAPEEAIAAWNTRAHTPTLRGEEVERLRTLSEAAKDGPWKVFSLVPGAYEVCKSDDYARGGVCVPHNRIDADFIVAAVNHVRAALSQPLAVHTGQSGEAGLRMTRNPSALAQAVRGWAQHIDPRTCGHQQAKAELNAAADYLDSLGPYTANGYSPDPAA